MLTVLSEFLVELEETRKVKTEGCLKGKIKGNKMIKNSSTLLRFVG